MQHDNHWTVAKALHCFYTVCPPGMWNCSWVGSLTAGGRWPGSSDSGRCLWWSSHPGWDGWSGRCRRRRRHRWWRRSSGRGRCPALGVSWRCPPPPPCWTSGHPPWRLLLCWQEIQCVNACDTRLHNHYYCLYMENKVEFKSPRCNY